MLCQLIAGDQDKKQKNLNDRIRFDFYTEIQNENYPLHKIQLPV